jgi:chaperonin GroES
MLKPLGERIVVKPIKAQEVTSGGIVLPDTAKESPREGEVVGVGPGRTLKSGAKVPIEVNVGDRVIYSKYGGTEVKIGDEEYVILTEDDVLAIVE